MNRTRIELSIGGNMLADDSNICDQVSFLDPKGKRLMIKKTIGGNMYLLIFMKRADDKYHFLSGERFTNSDEVPCINVDPYEINSIINVIK